MVLTQTVWPIHTHTHPSSLSISIFLPKLQTTQIHPLCLSLPLTAEASWYLVPPLVTLVSDAACQSGDWEETGKAQQGVPARKGKAFQSQLPPVGRGCPQRMKSGRAPHRGKSAGSEVSGTHHTAAETVKLGLVAKRRAHFRLR